MSSSINNDNANSVSHSLYYFYNEYYKAGPGTTSMVEMDTGMMTMDPGWSLIVGCCTACLLLFATLPCVVSLSSKYERRERRTKIGQTQLAAASKQKNDTRRKRQWIWSITRRNRNRRRDDNKTIDNDTSIAATDDAYVGEPESTSSSSSSSSAGEGTEYNDDIDLERNSVSDRTDRVDIITNDSDEQANTTKSDNNKNKTNHDLGLERVESLIQLGYLEPTRSSFSASKIRRYGDNNVDNDSSSEASISLYEQYAFSSRIPSELPAPPPLTRTSTVSSTKLISNANGFCTGPSGRQFICPMEPFPFNGDDDEEEENIMITKDDPFTDTKQKSSSMLPPSSSGAVTVESITQFVDWICQSFVDTCNKPLPSRSARLLKQQQLTASSVSTSSTGAKVVVPLKMGDYEQDDDDHGDNAGNASSWNPFSYLVSSFLYSNQRASIPDKLPKPSSATYRDSKKHSDRRDSVGADTTDSTTDSNQRASIPNKLPTPSSVIYRDSMKHSDRRDSVGGDTTDNSASILSPLDEDAVSFTDAIDHYRLDNPTPATTERRKMMLAASSVDDQSSNSGDVLPAGGDIDVFCGPRAWWRPVIWKESMDRLIHISDLDDEMWALIRSMIPLSTQALVAGSLQIIEVGLIGRLLGTPALTIFVVVGVLTWLPTTFVYGFAEALAKIVPDTIERDIINNNGGVVEDEELCQKENQGGTARKIGQYFTTAVVWIMIGMIPIGLFWSYFTATTFEWLGMTSSLAIQAQPYAHIQVLLEFLTVIVYTFHLFLDLVGLSTYSSVSSILYSVGQTVGVVIPIVLMTVGSDVMNLRSTSDENILIYIVMSRTFIAALHLVTSMIVVSCSTWLERGYIRGIFDLPMKNCKMSREVFWAAVPLGFAYFLTYAEWELLGVVFARVLGPAEVVTWTLLGFVWYLLKYVLDGLADSVQLRCCHWLISNEPWMAKTSSQKAHFAGVSLSFLLVSILFMTGKELVQWMTVDLVLQNMIVETFPLLGVGLVVQSVGAISFSVISAQEDRLRLSHTVQFIGTWAFTSALSAIFCFWLRIDLQGLTCAVVLGLAISGAGQTYLLMKSDWVQIAATMSKGLVVNSQQILSAPVPPQEVDTRP